MGVFNACTFVGEFANDAAALTEIQTRKWDSTNNGAGNPVAGMLYWDTTLTALKIYAAGAWQVVQMGSGTVGSNVKDIWSEPQAVATLPTAGAALVALPSVVVPNFSITPVRVIAIVKFRKTRNTSALESYLNENGGGGPVTKVQVKESVGGAWTNAIDMARYMLRVPAGPGDNPGDALIGDNDIVAEVADDNKTYSFQFDANCVCHNGPIELHDVQTGLRIWY